MKNFEIKNQNGRSMIEMLGVLAIIGVLSVGGIAGYSKAMMKYRINKTIEQITLVTGNVRAFFGPQGNYKGVGVLNVKKKAKLISDEMWDSSSNKFVNPFGGYFQLYDVAYKSGNTDEGTQDSKAFAVEFAGLDIESCIELVTQDWSNISQSFIGLSISTSADYSLINPGCNEKRNGGDGIYLRACVNGATIGIPVPLDVAADACSQTYNFSPHTVDPNAPDEPYKRIVMFLKFY